MGEILTLGDCSTWSMWPRHRLEDKKAENHRAWALGFQMNSYSDEELMFPSFGKCREHGVVIGNIVRAGWPMFTGVDLSSDKRPGTAIFTAALDPSTYRRYAIDVRVGSWTSPQTLGQLAELLNAFPSIQTILVENNAYQQSLIDWIRTSQSGRMWLKVEPFTTTGQNKMNPTIGLPILEVELSKRMWVIPHSEYEAHNPSCLCGWCTWDRQMTTYPHCVVADTVMANWFCRTAIDRFAGIVGGIQTSLSNFNDR